MVSHLYDYPPPRVAFLDMPVLTDARSNCLLDYIYAKGESPVYLIFARKTAVEVYVKGRQGHCSRRGGWAAHYAHRCQVVVLADVDIRDIKKREEEKQIKKVAKNGWPGEGALLPLDPNADFYDSDVDTIIGDEDANQYEQERAARHAKNEVTAGKLIQELNTFPPRVLKEECVS